LSNYQIFETYEFLKKVKKIANRDQIFIERKLLQHIYPKLKEESHYGNNIKKLMDYKPETWRYRIGKYRLFYVIDENEKTVYILSIDLRKDAY
jgi:mRNA interferase RelE/StbE